MNEKPILFATDMVRAILEGRKTQTRRVIAPNWWRCLDPDEPEDIVKALSQCPYGQPGDRLWVREGFAIIEPHPIQGETHTIPKQDPRRDERLHKYWSRRIVYRADPTNNMVNENTKWHPSIHMPRWMNRITLEITSMRIERVQDISPSDIVAEGFHNDVNAVERFGTLWDSLYAQRGYGWDSNPCVWAISFVRLPVQLR